MLNHPSVQQPRHITVMIRTNTPPTPNSNQRQTNPRRCPVWETEALNSENQKAAGPITRRAGRPKNKTLDSDQSPWTTTGRPRNRCTRPPRNRTEPHPNRAKPQRIARNRSDWSEKDGEGGPYRRIGARLDLEVGALEGLDVKLHLARRRLSPHTLSPSSRWLTPLRGGEGFVTPRLGVGGSIDLAKTTRAQG
jgi:hypothetical protein